MGHRTGRRHLGTDRLAVRLALLAVLIEGLRPQNAYRHLDPRFSYLDRGPTIQQNADTTDLWYIVPGLVASALLLLTFVVR